MGLKKINLLLQKLLISHSYFTMIKNQFIYLLRIQVTENVKPAFILPLHVVLLQIV